MICRLLLHEIRENGKNNSQSHGVSLGEVSLYGFCPCGMGTHHRGEVKIMPWTG